MQEMPDSVIIRRLYGLIAPYRAKVFLGMLFLILSVAAELYPPLVWERVVDIGLVTGDWGYIAWQIVLLVVIFGLGQLFSAIRGVLLEQAGQQLTLDLRTKLYNRLQLQSASFYAQRRTGDLLARLTADVENIQDVMVRGTDAVVANALRVLGVAAIFIWLQPKLGLLTILPMIVVGMLLFRFNRQVRPVYRAARERLGDISARLADNLGGIRVIQSFARERYESQQIEKLGKELYDEQVSAVQLRNRIFPLIRWIANFGNVIMLAGGVYFIMQGEFTLGGLLAYRGYGRYFYGPIDDLVNINDLIQRAAAAGRRVFEVLDAPISVADRPDAIALPSPLRGEVRFEKVSFAYDNSHPVLQGIDLHIRAGERVAILGPSGAGKSTLLALATRLYDPTEGRVLIDGHDLRDVTLESIHAQIAQVQQETYLFNATILENLRYSRPQASLEQVEAAARAANAHSFIKKLPQGYETMVGERGLRLSGGQKQRIAVARALLADPQLLVLDEPTSAVEPESEAAIVEALERLMQGRSALIVSHRLSLAVSADRVIVVADGTVVEDGPPAELANNSEGYFAAMLRADSAFVLDPPIDDEAEQEAQPFVSSNSALR